MHLQVKWLRRAAIAENSPKNFFPKCLPDESTTRAKGPWPPGLAFLLDSPQTTGATNESQRTNGVRYPSRAGAYISAI